MPYHTMPYPPVMMTLLDGASSNEYRQILLPSAQGCHLSRAPLLGNTSLLKNEALSGLIGRLLALKLAAATGPRAVVSLENS